VGEAVSWEEVGSMTGKESVRILLGAAAEERTRQSFNRSI
jgi:hypothetical protein